MSKGGAATGNKLRMTLGLVCSRVSGAVGAANELIAAIPTQSVMP